MAASGIVLLGFVIGHLADNLLIYAGRDTFNEYAATLKGMPLLIWTTRIVLLVTLAAHVTATAVRAAAALGMLFAGADIKLLPDGRHVVLDVNPSPMFARLDHLVGEAIAAGLARRLMASSS